MSPLGQFLSDTTVQVNPDEMGCGRRGCFTRAEPRASLEAAAVHRLSLGWQLPWHAVTAWLLFFRTRRKHIFPLPCLGNRKQILIKTLPHTDWAGKRWSLATLRFVLQMQTSNYCKVSDRMAGLTNVYSPWCCCFQMYLYFMQTYP